LRQPEALETNKKYWFESWFDSPYYHLLYQNRDSNEAKHFINNLLDDLSLPKQAKLLDLACGKGRHSIYFSQKKLITTGIDLSTQSIHYAQQFENNKLSFFIHDMRLPFRVNYFDVVMNLFTSFGYFEKESDNLKTIQSAALALKKGGVLVIDFMNSEKIINEIIPFEEKTVSDVSFQITKKLVNRFLRKEISFTDNGETFSFCENVKALQLKEFENYFSKSGLELVKTFGNYDLAPYQALHSDRLILMAQKI
jgi:SAM-dependent methyltransferase